jgi:YD repeat-containing protein
VVGTPTLNDFPAGKTTTYTYSKGLPDERLNHNLLSVTDAKGQTYLTNEYSPSTSVLDINFDRVTRQILGGPNDIIDVTYAEIAPAPANNFAVLEVVTNDRVGNVRLDHFNDLNLLVLSRDFTGRAIPNLPTQVTWTVQNLPGPPLRSSDPPWYDAIYEWNGDALPTRIVHPEQNETRFVYDAFHPDRRSQRNVLEVQQDPGPRGGLQSLIVDLFLYDDSLSGFGSNFVTHHTDGRGATTVNQYDSNGNLLKTTHRLPSIVNDYTYNSFGQMTSHTLPDDGTGTRRVDIHTYYTPIDVCRNGYLQDSIIDSGGLFIARTHQPDCLGRVEREVDPLGNDTILDINALNQIVRETSREVTPGGVRYERDFFYDANDNLVRIDTQNVDENGVLDPSNEHFTNILEYDILDYLIRTTEESGAFVVTRVPPQLDATGLPDSEFVTTKFEYDANRNRTHIHSGEASEGRQPTNTITWLYDERDLVFELIRAESDPEQSSTRYNYDGNGNVIRIEQGREAAGLGGTVREHTRTYDGYDRVVVGEDPMGNQTFYDYDENHNVVRSELQGELNDNVGAASNTRLHESLYFWDPMDRPFQFVTLHFDPVTQVAIGDGQSVFEATWADAGLLLDTTDDLFNSVFFTYDTAHRPKIKTDAKGNSVETFYDSNSNVVRVLTTELSDGGNPAQQFERTSTYDGLDRLTGAVDGVGNTSTYEYDSRGNTVLAVDPVGNTSRFGYDGLDRLISTTHDLTDTGDGSGSLIGAITIQGVWDDSDRLVAEVDANGNQTEYTYDALDRLIFEQFPDTTTFMHTFDSHHNKTAVLDPSGTLLVSD